MRQLAESRSASSSLSAARARTATATRGSARRSDGDEVVAIELGDRGAPRVDEVGEGVAAGRVRAAQIALCGEEPSSHGSGARAAGERGEALEGMSAGKRSSK